MSWYGRNQLTPIVSEEVPKPACTSLQLWSRFAWLIMTPLGAPVEPEVYCNSASESSSIPGSTHPSPASAGSAWGAIHSSPGRSASADPEPCADSLASSEEPGASPRAIRASQSLTSARSRDTELLRRTVSGG